MPHQTKPSLGLLCLGLVGLLGCHDTPASVAVAEPGQPAPPADQTGPTRATPSGSALACDVSMGPNHEVHVAGHPTGIYADFDDEVRLRSFVGSEDAILVAVGRAHPWRAWVETTQQHTLWRIPCADPSAKQVAIHIEGADFSWAAPSPDGRGLYFSGPGVYFYDYATDTVAPVIEPPRLRECWMAESPVVASEYVVGWAGVGALEVLTGGPCGFEAEWLGAAEIIEIPADPAAAPPVRRPAAHVASVAADAKGRLWVANGGLCSEAETKMSQGAAGLWRSDDDGERWVFVAIPELGGEGVDAVWTAATAPDRLLLRSECCYQEAADFCPGGKLLRSDDAGASWVSVSPGASGPLRGDEGASYGPVGALRLGPELLELEAAVTTDLDELTVRSDDGGKHWALTKPAHEISPNPVSHELELHGWVFEAGPDGLLRRHAGEQQAEVVLRPLVITLNR